jgi:MFS family permease
MSVAIVLFAVFALTAANATVYATLGLFGRDSGVSEVQVGTIFAASGLLFVLTSSAWGRLADRRGKRLAIVIGLAGTAASLLVFAGLFALQPGDIAPAGLFVALLLARILYGLCAAGTQPAATAYTVEAIEPASRSTGAAWIGAAVGLGSIVGPLASACLVEVSFLLPLIGMGLLAMLAAVVVRAGIAEIRREEGHEVATTTRPPNASACCIVAFLFYFGFSALQPTTAFFVQDLYHIDTALSIQRASLVSVTFAASTFAVQAVVVGRLPLLPRRLLSVGMTMCLAGIVGCLFASEFVLLLIAFGIVGIGYGLAQPGLMALALLAADRDRQAEAAGQLQGAISAAWIAGPIVGTAVYAIDLRGALVTAAGTMVLGLLALLATNALSNRRGSVRAAGAAPQRRGLVQSAPDGSSR